MKKVLLATTALVVSTGFAMADVTLSGSASAGVAASNDGDNGNENDGNMHVYSMLELTATFSGMSDNGIAFGADLDIDASSASFDTGDFEWDEAPCATDNTGWCGGALLSFGSIHLSSNGLTVTFDHDGIDDLVDDGLDAHDIQVGYASGPISLDLTHDVDGDSSDSSSSFSAAYDQDGISASLGANDNDDTAISVGYASGAFSVGITLEDIAGAQDTTVEGSYTADAFTISAETSTGDSGDTWEIGVDFSQDNISVAASFDDASAWEITGSLDGGGGLSIVAGMNSSDAYYLGADLSF